MSSLLLRRCVSRRSFNTYLYKFHCLLICACYLFYMKDHRIDLHQTSIRHFSVRSMSDRNRRSLLYLKTFPCLICNCVLKYLNVPLFLLKEEHRCRASESRDCVHYSHIWYSWTGHTLGRRGLVETWRGCGSDLRVLFPCWPTRLFLTHDRMSVSIRLKHVRIAASGNNGLSFWWMTRRGPKVVENTVPY